MKTLMCALAAVVVLLICAANMTPATEGAGTAAAKAQVHLVATVEPVKEGDAAAALSREDVLVSQGKNRLKVNAWIPSRGEQAALQLFILIDETCSTDLGSQLADLREFIQAQPGTTWIGLGYMRNTTVNVVQNFTSDHAQVAKVLRLPLGTTSATDSVYLSLVALLQGWPESKARREVLLVTDGIDRLHGYATDAPAMPSMSMAPRSMPYTAGPSLSPGMPYISPDVDQASRAAQRYGVIVHSIYHRGVGRYTRNYYEANNGQNGLAKLSDETGGESYFLGVQNPVSFKPYLDELQRILDNQYFLVFEAAPRKKADLQHVKVRTEVPKVEIATADNVWVPAAPQLFKK